MTKAESKAAAEALGTSNEIDLKAVRLPRFTSQQMNATLASALPVIKAERERRERRGKKSSYTRERFMRVIELIAGGKTQREALAIERLSSQTFHSWIETGGGDPNEAAFCQNAHARAKLALADHAFSEALDVPRQLYALALEGTQNGQPVDSSTVQAAKLLTDSLWRYAERLNPVYADRSKDVPVVNVTNNSLTISGNDLNPEQRAQLRALLTAGRDSGPMIEG